MYFVTKPNKGEAKFMTIEGEHFTAHSTTHYASKHESSKWKARCLTSYHETSVD